MLLQGAKYLAYTADTSTKPNSANSSDFMLRAIALAS